MGPVISLSDAISIENFLSPQIDRPLAIVILVRIVYYKIASLSTIAKPTSPVYMNPLVAKVKILAVKVGTSSDPDCLPFWAKCLVT